MPSRLIPVGAVLVQPARLTPIPGRSRGSRTQLRFDAFHAANPWVLTALEQLTAQYLRKHDQARARTLWEHLRWCYEMRPGQTGVFRANDHLLAPYVRLLVERHPEWQPRFDIRDPGLSGE